MDNALDIFGDLRQGYDDAVNAQNLMNRYVELDKSTPTGYAFLPTPGTRLVKTLHDLLGTASVRALFRVKDNAYGVIGDGFFKFEKDLSYIRIGTLNTETGPISWTNNLTEILLVDGGSGYLWDGSTFTNPSGFPSNPIDVTYLDGFFYVAQSSTNRVFKNENIEDGSTWLSTDFVELTTDANAMRGLVTLKRQVYFLGSSVVEQWQSVGGVGFPIQRNDNFAFAYGCLATASLVTINEFAGDRESGEGDAGYVVWLGESANGDPAVVATDGGPVQPISTVPIELELQKLTSYSDAIAMHWKINAHVWYVLTFPTDNKTLVYDFTTKTWFSLTMTEGDMFFSTAHMYFNDTHYVGNRAAPELYELSRHYSTYDGAPIPRTRVTKQFRPTNGKRLLIDEVEVVFSQGNAPLENTRENIFFDNSGAAFLDNNLVVFYEGAYPYRGQDLADDTNVAYLSASEDNGVTWGIPIAAPLGAVGQRRYKTQWGPLGIYDSVVFRIETQDQNGLVLTGANWEVKEVRR